MRFLPRIVKIALISIILLSTTNMANAETSQEQLQQAAELINQKVTEKENITNELHNIQNELASMETEIAKNEENLTMVEQKIAETQQLIQSKKDEIVILEDKVYARKGIMQERLVSLQHTDSSNLIFEVLLNSKSINDFITRATAVSTVISADKDLLEQQQRDLKKIEDEKLEVIKQEQILDEQFKTLASSQANLEQNLLNRQQTLAGVQEKYNQVLSAIEMAEEEKAAIQAQITQAQNKVATKQQESAARSQQIAQKSAGAAAAETPTTNGTEIYVTSTAYSHEESSTGMTALGYNIKANPNMKLIAVDPSVIPLGSRVWVEGYGEAVAGDTGGAIKGHKIDVLMPSGAAARNWGRKTVKIKILN